LPTYARSHFDGDQRFQFNPDFRLTSFTVFKAQVTGATIDVEIVRGF